MQPEEHYIRLYRQLSQQQIPLNAPITVTLAEIADWLCCTSRNAVFLLRKWESRGWVSWAPGNGRSRYSRLTLIESPEEILFTQAKKQFEQGNRDDAFLLLSTNPEAEYRFANWLSRHLGYRLEALEKNGELSVKESLSFSFYRPVSILDPALVVRQTEYHLISQLFDTLLLFDADGDVRPHLAHAWEHSADYRQWIFYLRKGVLFHHGEEMTAHDVIFSLKRVLDPVRQSPHRHHYQNLCEFEVEGTYKLKLATCVPEPMLPQILAHPASSILSRNAEKSTVNSAFPIGSGPYQLLRNHAKGLILRAFDRYFRGRAHLDEVAMWVIPESRNLADLNQNRVRFIPFADDRPTDSKDLCELERNDLELKFLVFNLNKTGPQHDLQFRAKVTRMVTSSDIAEALGRNRLTLKRIASMLGEELDDDLNPEFASLAFSSYDMPLHADDLQWISRRLVRSGIDCTSIVLPYEQWILFSEPADLWLGSAVLHPSRELSEMAILSESSSPLRHALDAQQLRAIDAEVASIRQETDSEIRRQRLDRLFMKLRDNCIWIPLYTTFQRTQYDKRLKGVRLSAYAFPEYPNIWMHV